MTMTTTEPTSGLKVRELNARLDAAKGDVARLMRERVIIDEHLTAAVENLGKVDAVSRLAGELTVATLISDSGYEPLPGGKRFRIRSTAAHSASPPTDPLSLLAAEDREVLASACGLAESETTSAEMEARFATMRDRLDAMCQCGATPLPGDVRCKACGRAVKGGAE